MALFSNLRYRRGGDSLAVRSVPSTVAELASDFSNVPRDHENVTNRERMRPRGGGKSLTVKPIQTTQRVRPRDCALSFPVLCRLLALSFSQQRGCSEASLPV
jgi:hypothetical protein